jgi:hypothetical protein
MRKFLILFLMFPVISLIASCAAPPSNYNPIATIKDIMDSAVDPSADYLWESIRIESGPDGIVERRPQTDEEWKEERRHAVLLVEAANLLMMPGRKVAKPGDKAEAPEVELSPEQIQALIDKDRDTFIKLAKEFQQTAIEQLKAVDDRNVDELFRTGGDLDTRCENCHKVYWYPNDPNFKQPAEGQPAAKAEEKK